MRGAHTVFARGLRFTFQTAGALIQKNPKLRRPCSRKARGAPAFPVPSLIRGMLPHKREGSGAPKGAGNIDTPCGARPVRWAFTSRRSTAAFFLRPRDRLL